MPRVNSITPSAGTLNSLKENLDELMKLTAGLEEALKAATPDYDGLAKNSKLIQRTARCIQSLHGLGPTALDHSKSSQIDKPGNLDLRGLVAAIDQAVHEFAGNPMFLQTRVIDAQVIGEASLVLERIVNLSGELRVRAEILNGGTVGKSPGKVAGQKYKRPYGLYVSAECHIWRADTFSRLAATVENEGSTKIEGIKVQLNRHKLAQRNLISLEECMTRAIDEKAAAEGERYAVSVKDFHSFEVNGRAFAYRVDYQVVRTKDEKIRFRAFNLLVLYFIDEVGQGEFELVEGTFASGLPLWVKELTPNRWATSSKRN